MKNKLTPHIDYYSNGNVKVKGQKNSIGQMEGIWEVFFKNGNIRRRTPYVGGEKDGIVEEFYEDGKIHWRIPFKGGKEDGIVEWFHENGNIIKTTLWKDGELIEETKH